MRKVEYPHKYQKSDLAMADSSNYQPTPTAQKILEMLRDVGEWMNRSALTRRLSKNALNKWDIILLSKLTEAGLIESQQIPHHGPIGYEWQYRAVLKPRVKPEDICSNA